MKKIIVLMMCLVLLGTAALAEGQLSLSHERYTLDDDGEHAYVFAKVENIGDKAVKVADAKFELLDAEGRTLADTESVKAVARMHAILGDVFIGGNVMTPGGFAVGTVTAAAEPAAEPGGGD